ncbi:unnamed protein product, partial [Iphiclides podalirius]
MRVRFGNVSLPFFTYGVENDVLTATSKLGPTIENLNVPWSTVAFILSSIVAAPLHCFVINRYGRRVGIYLIVLLQGIVCVPLLIALTDASVIIQGSIAGVATGGLFVVVPIYVREVSSDGMRGVTLALMMLMAAAGNAMKLLLSEDSMLYLMVGFVAIELVVVFLIPESPGFLVMRDKLLDAQLSTAKLVCLKHDQNFVTNEVRLLKEESDRAKSTRNLGLFNIPKHKIWRDQMKIGLLLNTTTILSGCSIFLDQDKALAQLKTDIDPEKMLVPISLLLGGFSCVVLVNFLERKYLLTISYSVMILSMGTLAVYTQADLTVTSLRWVPIVALAILVISYGVVWSLPTVILAEMLNIEIRATAMGVIYVYSQTVRLLHTLTFQYLEDYIGIYTLLYLCACINIFGAIYAISMIPDIKNKSVKQIERQLRRVPILKL